jgi:hypothetical protein
MIQRSVRRGIARLAVTAALFSSVAGAALLNSAAAQAYPQTGCAVSGSRSTSGVLTSAEVSACGITWYNRSVRISGTERFLAGNVGTSTMQVCFTTVENRTQAQTGNCRFNAYPNTRGFDFTVGSNVPGGIYLIKEDLYVNGAFVLEIPRRRPILS